MEVQGKIKLIEDTIQVNDTFKKRGLVLVTDENYPQSLYIEFVQDKCDILDKYKVDDEVNIHINLRGREWTNSEGEVKYFNSIQGWRIEHITEGEVKEIQAGVKSEESKDDLPF